MIKLYRQTLTKVSVNPVQGLGLTNYYIPLFAHLKKKIRYESTDGETEERKEGKEEGREEKNQFWKVRFDNIS